MTKVPTGLGRAAKADRLVMVGLRRVPIRELNCLSEKRGEKYDNRVCADAK